MSLNFFLRTIVAVTDISIALSKHLQLIGYTYKTKSIQDLHLGRETIGRVFFKENYPTNFVRTKLHNSKIKLSMKSFFVISL